MKIDLAAFDLADVAQLRTAALKIVAELSLIPQLKGKEKLELLVKTLKEAIESLPDGDPKVAAQKWVDETLPHVVEAALFVLPHAEKIAEVAEVVQTSCLRLCFPKSH
jgi:hypothetical protein